MRRGGRAIRESLVSLFYLYSCLTTTAGVDYGVPVEIKLWDNGRTPIAHMVDVTNGFGLKVLAEHNFLNDNNIAFSPYGLMGIMVALFEGVDGESAFQIQRGMQLPWNRNVMRIGFRDIHRTLKTYFVPEEGFLAGLALNNENVTFDDNYKKILRFYGFDLENDKLPTAPPTNGTNETTPASTSPSTSSEVTTMTTPMTTEIKTVDSTTAMREETTNPNAETINVREQETTTSSPSSAPNAESTAMPVTSETTIATESSAQTTETVLQTTEGVAQTSGSGMQTSENVGQTSESATQTTESVAQTTNVETAATTTASQTTVTTVAPMTTNSDTMTTEASVSIETDAETIAQQTSQASSALTEPTSNNEVASTVDMGTVTTEATSIGTTNDMTETVTTSITNTPTDGSTTSADMTTLADVSTTGTLETLQRRKKSIVDFIFTNPPYVDDYFFYRSYNEGPDLPIPGFDDKMFLANGLKSVQVPYMHYDTVLEHAYLPHLEASALRLPLDSERYYLLVVLPTRGGSAELGRLLGRMARESDLADVYAALRPRRVRAVVPSFIVKGHVTLTTDLQKLGIRDVFEPRQRDFTPMTRQGGVYVRSIEQAVSVAIRKYRLDDHKKNRYVLNRDPVTFSATYPFLYFVMDATIHVALMAGKMVDPLNTRIL